MWHSIFDKAFCITLNNPLRIASVKRQMEQYHLPLDLMMGIKDENGEKGLKDTMKFIFDHCIMMGYKKVLILEDDFEFLHHPDQIMNLVVNEMPKEFDMLYFGATLLSPPSRHTKHLLILTQAYTSHAVLYSIPAMRTVSDQINSYGKAYDQFLNEKIISLGKSFCLYPLLVNQKLFPSAIQKFDKSQAHQYGEYYDEECGCVRWDKFIIDQYNRNTKHLA